MHTKLKYRDTIRKIRKTITTFEDLKSGVGEAYGLKILESAAFHYIDIENEKVSIVGDEDIKDAIGDAKEMGRKTILIVIETPSTTATKNTQREGMRTGKGARRVHYSPRVGSGERIEELKIRLQDQNKEEETRFKDSAEYYKNLNTKLPKHIKKKCPKFVKAIIDQERDYKAHTGKSMPRLKDLYKDFFSEFPEFVMNPELSSILISEISEEFKERLEEGALKIIKENPNLVDKGRKYCEVVDSLKDDYESKRDKKLDKQLTKAQKYQAKMINNKDKNLKKWTKSIMRKCHDKSRAEVEELVSECLNQGRDYVYTENLILGGDV